ncbi:hypothetical protein THAOC_22765, partial [Thalassiosira oceanica]
GRNGGLESACRALDLSNVAVAVLQETTNKITTDAYTKFSLGYRVQASKATSVRQGGVALCYRDDHPGFELEEQRFFGPNVVTFQLIITGRAKYYCVGAYIPPSDDTQVTQLARKGSSSSCSTDVRTGAGNGGSIAWVVGYRPNQTTFWRHHELELGSGCV